MFCGECGSIVTEGRRFCGNCGAAVRAGATPSGAVALDRPVREISQPQKASAPWSFARKFMTGALLVILTAAGVTFWWWKHRPVPPYKVQDPGVYPFVGLGADGHTPLFGFIDANGNVVESPTWNGISTIAYYGSWDIECSEGLCPVSRDGKWGFVDLSGKIAISPQFDSARPFIEGLARVSLGNLFGFIDKTGRYVVNPQFGAAGDFHGGLAAAQEDSKWGFIDRTGHWTIKPQFSAVDPGGFSDGLEAACGSTSSLFGGSGAKCGYISRAGTFSIKPQFDREDSFSEGLSAVQIGGKWGYINTSGSIVINPQFDKALRFSAGYALVEVSGKQGTIDRLGKYILNPGEYAIAIDTDDLLHASLGNQMGLLSRDGKWVVQPTSALIRIGPIYGKVFEGTISGMTNPVPISTSGKVLAGWYKGASLDSLGPDITNETSALASMHTLVSAEASYSNSFPAIGFAASLASLGPATSGNTDESHAGLVDATLVTGAKDNYQFKIEIPNGTSTGGTNFNYVLTAMPLPGHAGRIFCADSTGTIRYSLQGESCTTSSPAVPPR